MVPINELCVSTCLDITSGVNEIPTPIVDNLAHIGRAVIGCLPFHVMFVSNHHLDLGEEDTAMIYLFVSSTGESDVSLIVSPHISVRAIFFDCPFNAR
jgi:hypothetical protein